jgi:hypothetical protein
MSIVHSSSAYRFGASPTPILVGCPRKLDDLNGLADFDDREYNEDERMASKIWFFCQFCSSIQVGIMCTLPKRILHIRRLLFPGRPKTR